MFQKKKKCGVCGYRVAPDKEKVYVAEEPRAFMETLTNRRFALMRLIARVAAVKSC